MRRGRPRHPELLTPREQQVLDHLRGGLTNAEIAVRLGISPDGVKYHVSEILSKLGVSTRQDAVAWAERRERVPRLRLPVGLTGAWRRFGPKLVVGSAVAAVAIVIAVVVASFFRSDDAVQPGLGKLAFIVDGNLWVKDLPQGTPRQLTNDGVSWNPRWSASGKWLSDGFVDGTQASGRPRFDADIIRADGSSHRFASGCGMWSPTDDVMACWGSSIVRIETPEGYVTARFDVAPLVRQADNVSVADVGVCTWSPDGLRLVCSISEAGHSGTPPHQYSGLWSFLPDGSDPHELFANNAYAPDGGYVAILGVKRDGISPGGVTVGFTIFGGTPCNESFSCTVDGATLYETPLTGGTVRHAQGQYYYTTAGSVQGNGSKDGSTAVLSEGAGRETWANKRIALVPDTGPLRYLTDSQTASIAPFMSLDGSRIVYVSGPDAGHLIGDGTVPASSIEAAQEAKAQRKLWLMDADGTNKRPLTNDTGYRDERPYWSRNGEQVLFGRIGGEGAASIWFVSPSDGSLQKLADVSALKPQSGVPLAFTRDDYFKRYWDFYGIIPWQFLYAWWQPKAP